MNNVIMIIQWAGRRVYIISISGLGPVVITRLFTLMMTSISIMAV